MGGKRKKGKRHKKKAGERLREHVDVVKGLYAALLRQQSAGGSYQDFDGMLEAMTKKPPEDWGNFVRELAAGDAHGRGTDLASQRHALEATLQLLRDVPAQRRLAAVKDVEANQGSLAHVIHGDDRAYVSNELFKVNTEENTLEVNYGGIKAIDAPEWKPTPAAEPSSTSNDFDDFMNMW
jgi:hypothetical protein